MASRMAGGTDIDKGWAFVILLASCMSLTFICGGSYGTTVFNPLFLDKFQQSNSLTSFAGSLVMGLQTFTGPLASLVTHRFGWRVTVMAGGLIAALGTFFSAWTNNFVFILVGYGAFGGFGIGLAYVPTVTIVGFYFRKYRTLALGLASVGAGLAMMIVQPLMQTIGAIYSVRMALVVQSATYLQICVCGALMRPIPTSHSETHNDTLGFYDSMKSLKDGRFLIICVSVLFIGTGLSAAHVHFTAFVAARGASSIERNYLLITMGIWSIICRLFVGVAANNRYIGSLILYLSTAGISAFILLLAPAISYTQLGRMFYVSLLGFYSNTFNALLAPVTVDYIGLRLLPTAFGLEMVVNGIAFLIGPTVAGCLLDITGSYDSSFYLAGLCYLVGALVMLPMPILDHKTRTGDALIFSEKVSSGKEIKERFEYETSL